MGRFVSGVTLIYVCGGCVAEGLQEVGPVQNQPDPLQVLRGGPNGR